jgi:hypothetical protein
MGGASGWSVSPPTWEYKFVDIMIDRREFEKVITQHGKDGWELCSSERFTGQNKTEIALVFKKRKGGDVSFGGGGGGTFGPGGPGGGFGGRMGGGSGQGTPGGRDENVFQVFQLKHASAAEVVAAVNKAIGEKGQRLVAETTSNAVVLVGASAAVLKDITKLIEDLDAKATKPGSGGPKPGSGSGPGPMGGGKPQPDTAKPGMFLNVFKLQNAKAEEMVVVLQKLFPNAEMVADPRTNTVIARADEKGLEEMKMLIARLEAADTVKPK